MPQLNNLCCRVILGVVCKKQQHIKLHTCKAVFAALNSFNAQKLAQSNADEEAAENFSTVKSLAFFHIPLRESRTAWLEYVANGYEDTDNTKRIYGTAGESGEIVYCGVGEDTLFETMLELGSTKGIFNGHDHLNNFSMDYEGIRLTYGYSIDYLAYIGIKNIGSQRGCTVITVSPDGSFDCEAKNYYLDEYVPVFPKGNVDMQQLNAEMSSALAAE